MGHTYKINKLLCLIPQKTLVHDKSMLPSMACWCNIGYKVLASNPLLLRITFPELKASKETKQYYFKS